MLVQLLLCYEDDAVDVLYDGADDSFGGGHDLSELYGVTRGD